MIDLTSQKGLRELEAQCIQENAPPCQATCPLHVDVRGMMAAVSRGEFAAAQALFVKSVPFPGIISRLCDEPCRPACTRGQVGDPISIRAIEAACMAITPVSGKVQTANVHRPATLKVTTPGKRVAVIGGGLSGLTAAHDLARKGYALTLFEAGGALGGRALHAPPAQLPAHVLEEDLELLPELGVEVRLDAAVDNSTLDRLCADYHAVYLAVGVATGAAAGTANGAGNGAAKTAGSPLNISAGSIDPVTFATGRPGLFAGGSLLRENWSPITSMSDGRRAAISIDRYLQNVSLTASRDREGAYQTALYTNVAGIEPLAETPPLGAPHGNGRNGKAAAQQAESARDALGRWATTEAGRCLQCACLECVKVCDYLAEYGSYPRKYVRTIYNNLSIVMGERHANQFINSCAVCGLCAAVCPTQMDMGAICRTARSIMVQQKRMPPGAHDFALRDMAFSNGEHFALARHHPGTQHSDYLFFPGCQLAGSSPAHVEAVYDYLQEALPGNVGLMLGCCGAPADWAGRDDLRAGALAQFQAAHEALGRPRLVLACSSCMQLFRAQLPEVELLSLWNILDERGLPEQAAPFAGSGAFALHDPCTTRYEPAVQESVRRLLDRLGYQTEELPRSRERTTCCGFGGLMVYANRPLARQVVQRRIAESDADYVTYCAVCRDYFAAQGKPALHLLDLIFGGGSDGRAGPGFSQKHENRARLKRRMLLERWGETVAGEEEYAAVRLRLSDEVLAMMDERLILAADIQQVIAHAERTGQKLLSPQSGHLLAHFRPGAVTYWVEYAPAPDGYTVFNAYSHRMDVGEGKRS